MTRGEIETGKCNGINIIVLLLLGAGKSLSTPESKEPGIPGSLQSAPSRTIAAKPLTAQAELRFATCSNRRELTCLRHRRRTSAPVLTVYHFTTVRPL